VDIAAEGGSAAGGFGVCADDVSADGFAAEAIVRIKVSVREV